MTTRFTLKLVAAVGAAVSGTAFNSTAITFGDALEATNLVWSTGGDSVWLAATNGASVPANFATFDGLDAAATGVVGDNQSSWLQATVVGPGTLSFWWKASTEEGFDFYVFSVNGDWTDEISGDVNWQYRTYAITNVGPTVLRWEYTRDSSFGGGFNKAYLDQVKFASGPDPSLNTVLNTTFATWTTGGNDNPTVWKGQTNVSRMDGQAAESGAITTSQESWMETVVSGVTNVSFWWKVSSVTNHGWLQFYVNGSQQFQISGEVGWQLKTNVALSVGTNTLRWVCSTDALAIGKLNRGWVDEVQFSPALMPSTPLTLGVPVFSNGQVHLPVHFGAGWPCRILYSTNLAGGGWTQLVATNMTDTTIMIADPGATNTTAARFYRAQAP